ncbi:transporter substrate-binding domain-containing protein [Marinobacter confluentis]|uniref:Transporter substrate-binding domain-containing protein n=1 Tax=Marinobacter confluentis TaxID=1697557 RepID=A0A4Z1BP28_9GAMM|nr:transporter substrate-binding domain-containing protein [Marinobacter confluentis]TGN39227.1 transporter substrate-binding domain-containing protein [Marinobacter confluentis]
MTAVIPVKPDRLIMLALAAFLLSHAGLMTAAAKPDQPALSIVYDSFARFIYTEDGQARGLYVDIMNEALGARLDVPVDFVWEPWQRAQFSVESGSSDAMITFSTPTRRAYADAGEVPVAFSPVGLFTVAGRPVPAGCGCDQTLYFRAGLR